MEILDFSKERGIHAIFNGYGKQAYIFHSSFYGVVGYADIMDEPGTDKITVDLYFMASSKTWYWSLEKIIKRGITKTEHRYCEDRKITFNCHYLNNGNWGKGVTDNVFKYDNVLHVSTYDGIKEI